MVGDIWRLIERRCSCGIFSKRLMIDVFGLHAMFNYGKSIRYYYDFPAQQSDLQKKSYWLWRNVGSALASNPIIKDKGFVAQEDLASSRRMWQRSCPSVGHGFLSNTGRFERRVTRFQDFENELALHTALPVFDLPARFQILHIWLILPLCAGGMASNSTTVPWGGSQAADDATSAIALMFVAKAMDFSLPRCQTSSEQAFGASQCAARANVFWCSGRFFWDISLHCSDFASWRNVQFAAEQHCCETCADVLPGSPQQHWKVAFELSTGSLGIGSGDVFFLRK